MAVDFPSSPSVNDTHTANGRTWIWNGTAWAVRGGLAGGTTSAPGGSDGQVQYNDGGTTGGVSHLHYDDVNGRIGVGTASPAYGLDVSGEVNASTDVRIDGVSLDGLIRSAMPVGTVVPFAGSSSPDSSWLVCDGSAVSRTTYSALFALIGTTYGAGDGSSTFNTPNLGGRVPVGLDSGQSEFDSLGETGGSKTHTLTTAEMPSHTHTQNAHTHTQDAHTHTQNSHTHTINHNHASVTSGSGGDPHTHSVDPPNTTSSSTSHSHSQSGLSTNSQASGKFTKRIGSGSNWDVTSSSLARWDSATNPATSSSSHTHTTNIGSFTSGGASDSSHTHSVDLPNFTGTSGGKTATNQNTTATNQNTTATNQNTGGGDAHNILQPYMALNYIIKAA